MKRKAERNRNGLLLFLLSICLIISACGGGGGSESSESPSSPFAGHWVGTWSDPVNHQNGTLSLTIASDGTGTGSIHNTTLGLPGSASGNISNTGSGNFTYIYPAATFTATCTMSINSLGNLVGDCNEYSGALLFGTASIDLAKT